MTSSYQFRIDRELYKQVELAQEHDTLVVRVAYRVGNSVSHRETRIATVGVPRTEPNAHGVFVRYRERPFRLVPWLTIPRSSFF